MSSTTGTVGERCSAGYSFSIRLQIPNRPGGFAAVSAKLASLRASLAEVTLIASTFEFTTRDLTVSCRSEGHAEEVRQALFGDAETKVLGWQDDTLAAHRGGKLTIAAKSSLYTTDELSRVYTPGVARVCEMIHRNPDAAFDFTIKRNAVAVISDGSAVLGLGNIGPRAAMPVMEGKAILFKQFADIDAYPICLDVQDTEEIIRAVKAVSPGFGGINLEDISAPRCFEIEERLQAELDIPVFHDDQHGTAVVVLAGLLNSLKIVGKKISSLKVVINGFGAGGVACTRILLDAGVRNIVPCDTVGAVYRGRKEHMNSVKEQVIARTNPDNVKGSLAEAIQGADVFIGVSAPKTLTPEMVRSMAPDPIVFALANPIPEILPYEVEGAVRIIATGRSDYANQVNNVLCFPGIFRGALDCGARRITAGMKVAAAHAIAESVADDLLCEQKIIPGIFDIGVAERVAERVRIAATHDGVARAASNPGPLIDNVHRRTR